MSAQEPTAQEIWDSCLSETAKHRSITEKYCYNKDGKPGCGVDLGSQGDCVVPWAMGLDQPLEEFNKYCGNHPPKGPIQMRGHADQLPFDDASLDFVYSSHLLEDYKDWVPILGEWLRVIKPGGHLIILVPDKKLWNEAIARGQPGNPAHQHESEVGELSSYAPMFNLTVIEDRLTALIPTDYSVVFIARKN